MCHQLLPFKRLWGDCSNVRRGVGWLLVSLCIGCMGCSGPQSILDPAGPSALIISWLWWGMFSFFTLVFVIVVTLWIYAMRKGSQVPDSARARVIHNRWIIGGGIILPLTTVTVLLAVGIPAGQRVLLLPPSEQAPLRVDVVGHRWWWEIRYPDADVIIANQLYVPVNRPLDFHVTTADVIHSFWVPRLGRKIDMVPGRVHQVSLLASSVGTMRGQCAEFCGTGHAHMVLDVEVLEADAFESWLQQRQQPIDVPAEYAAAADAFRDHCGDCHRVAGISTGTSAPDLSDVGARRLLGAGMRSEDLNVGQWLATHPTFVKESSTLDHSQLAVTERSEIAAWLETLGND